jgi:hypothetical protein
LVSGFWGLGGGCAVRTCASVCCTVCTGYTGPANPSVDAAAAADDDYDDVPAADDYDDVRCTVCWTPLKTPLEYDVSDASGVWRVTLRARSCAAPHLARSYRRHCARDRALPPEHLHRERALDDLAREAHALVRLAGWERVGESGRECERE